MTKKVFIYLGLFLFFGLNGCASPQTNIASENKDTMLETYNRAMFSVNRKIDTYLVRPVVKGYKKVTNESVRTGVRNFFGNIGEPVSAVNHVLQGDIESSGKNLGRFVVNTTLGMAGLFDVATAMGLEKNKTGFDETLSTWCIPDGPFIVMPIIGPSTPRAFTGFAVDGYSSPIYWATKESSDSDADVIYYGLTGLSYINLMADNIGLLESLEEGSVDYYEAVKSSYLQNRKKLKSCNGEDSSLEYDFDMDMDN